jgi:hypothetical protein
MGAAFKLVSLMFRRTEALGVSAAALDTCNIAF